jgi:predicted nucleic acid-binding protein
VETGALRELLAGDRDQLASAIVEVEVIRAVRRRVPQLIAQAHAVVAQISVIELTEAIRARAAHLEPDTRRSLDALHLATALELGDELAAVVTYDARMAGAAASLGLAVLAPA